MRASLRYRNDVVIKDVFQTSLAARSGCKPSLVEKLTAVRDVVPVLEDVDS